MTELLTPADLQSLLRDFPAIRLLYLFGSRASGTAAPSSDYDLAVLLDRSVADDLDLEARLRHALVVALGSDQVDLVLLNRAPIELAYAVIAQGRLLCQRDLVTRVEYEADVMSRYCDYLPVLRAQRQAILAGGDHAARVQRHRFQRHRAALGRTERTLGEAESSRRTPSR